MNQTKRPLIAPYLVAVLVFASPPNADGSADEFDPAIKQSVLSDPDSITQGENRFSALCAYCHGHGGVGGKARKLRGRQFDADYVFRTITNGKKRGSLNMPPWRSLPEEARWQLVTYILSLSNQSD